MKLFYCILFYSILFSCQGQTNKHKVNNIAKKNKNLAVKKIYKPKLIKRYEEQRDVIRDKSQTQSSLSKLSLKQLYSFVFPLSTEYKRANNSKKKYKGFDFKNYQPSNSFRHPVIDYFIIYQTQSGETKQIDIEGRNMNLELIVYLDNENIILMRVMSEHSVHTVLLYDKERKIYFHLDILQAFRRKHYKKGEPPYELKTLTLLDNALYPICKLTFHYGKLAINTDIIYNGLSKKYEVMKKIENFTLRENILFGDLEKLFFAERTDELLFISGSLLKIKVPMWIFDYDSQYTNDPRYMNIEEEE